MDILSVKCAHAAFVNSQNDTLVQVGKQATAMSYDEATGLITVTGRSGEVTLIPIYNVIWMTPAPAARVAAKK